MLGTQTASGRAEKVQGQIHFDDLSRLPRVGAVATLPDTVAPLPPELAAAPASHHSNGAAHKLAGSKTLWPAILERVTETLHGRVVAPHVLKEAHFMNLDEKTLELGVANRFFADFIEEKYAAVILNAVEAVTGFRPKLKLSISGYLFRKVRDGQRGVHEDVQAELAKSEPRAPKAQGKAARRNGQIFRVSDKYRLDNFVVGECNRRAHSIAEKIAHQPRQESASNPLFVYGGPGTGKTHLLHGLANALQERFPDLNVQYVECECFLGQYIQAVKNQTSAVQQMELFRQNFRNADVLLVDDVHHLESKRHSQDEFLHTFNELLTKSRQIVLSSAVSPAALGKLSPQLVNRFQAGIVLPLEEPDTATRRQIIQRKLERHPGLNRSDFVAHLAERVHGDVRKIEGLLNKVTMTLSLQKAPLSPEILMSVVDELAEFNQRTIELDDIEAEVVKSFAITSAQLHSPSRKRDIALARQVCMYLARLLTGFSLNEIGRFFGDKDHATVVFSDKKVREKMGGSEELKNRVCQLESVLRAGKAE